MAMVKEHDKINYTTVYRVIRDSGPVKRMEPHHRHSGKDAAEAWRAREGLHLPCERTEMDELDPYYIEKAKRVQAEVQLWGELWAWGILIAAGLLIWCCAVKGLWCWLRH
jgi:hypothetical protein